MTEWKPKSEAIEVTLDREVAVILINRPEKLNALTADMRLDIAAAIRHYGDGERARGVVLTGTGRAFSAGEDLETAVDGTEGGVEKQIELFHDITRAVLETRAPLVAALNGIAVGGASEMTHCFDSRIGSTQAEYFMPENSMGLVVSNAASILLPRLIGGEARRVILESPRLSAEEAHRIGLIDRIVEPDELIDAAIDLVHRWTGKGMATAAHLKLIRPQPAEVEAAFKRETEVATEVWNAGVSQEGIDQFWKNQADRTA